jgi:S1-C subfamily serine protease
MNKRRFVTIALALVLALGILVAALNVNAQNGSTTSPTELPAAAAYQPNTQEQHTANLYQSVTQSVVNINVALPNGGATGSGFVIDNQGDIVTNNHVVDSATYIEVTFVDGTILQAKLVGTDPQADLAVVRVDPSAVTLKPVAFGDSDKVFVGEETYAIGSPFGEAFTLTSGIVSGLDRSLQNSSQFSIPKLIQTDAAINPGNSGGPLLDSNGDVIGVNTAILSDSNSGSGVGFAIPSNSVRLIVPYLIANGKYEHSWLGIAAGTLQPSERSAMNLPADLQGVMVSQVSSGGPAAQAGVKAATGTQNTPFGQVPTNGDIITAINGQKITQMSDLIDYLEFNTHPGDKITLTVWRDGKSVDLTVTLQARPTNGM